MEYTRKSNSCIQIVAGILSVLAIWFAKMPCSGRIYEPEMPECLKKDI